MRKIVIFKKKIYLPYIDSILKLCFITNFIKYEVIYYN